MLYEVDSANFPNPIIELELIKLGESLDAEVDLVNILAFKLLGLKMVIKLVASPFCLGITNSKVKIFLTALSSSVMKLWFHFRFEV